MNTSQIFCSYSPKDKPFMERLYAHLRPLELQGVSIWGTDDLLPGMKWEEERDQHLNTANIILLLVSANFIASTDLYTKEVQPALERHHRGEAHVLPILLSPVLWQGTLFGKLHPLPTNGRPVTDASWRTPDDAYLNIVHGIERLVTTENDPLSAQQKKHRVSPSPMQSASSSDDEAARRLAQIIHELRSLRAQIAQFVTLKDAHGFSLEKGETQYNKLYGDILVFLATYLATSSEEFVETVYRKTAEQLRGRNDVFVTLTRWIISPLAKLEKLAAQIDACVETLEQYKQKYFTQPS